MQTYSSQPQRATNQEFVASIFNPKEERDRTKIDELKKDSSLRIIDSIESQIRELFKLRDPEGFGSYQDLSAKIHNYLGEKPNEYGVWVYYPWRHCLVHIVGESEFIELRTNRNLYKITAEEQRLLSTKTIGVVGLSVGNSVALTLAMERIGGHLVLADYDHLEVSNLNRIRSGLPDLDIQKTVIAARQIAEIDPFLKVTLFSEGLSEDNMNAFLNPKEGMDLLVEVCDSIHLKVKSRLKARMLKIPVIMDTNDKGMVDIERFDLEPNRPIFHGLVDEEKLANLEKLEGKEMLNVVSQIISVENVSERLKKSMPEIGKTITSWPQLASGVSLGGAISANVSRRILLNHFRSSGRFYVDLDQTIK